MNKTGRKIWYGVAMFLCGLILLLSAAGVVGVWVVEQAAVDVVIQAVQAVDRLTVSLRQVTQGVDEKMERLESAASFVSTLTTRLSDKVTDQGVIMLLLPEEQEQSLGNLASSVKDGIETVRGTVSSGLTLYRTIDSLPFVDLPAPKEETVAKIGEFVDEIQSTTAEVQADVAAFRGGASDKIDRVVSGADKVTELVGQSRTRLANLDARLAMAQEALPGVQKKIINFLILAAVLITLLLAWIIYSQVELLRLFIMRWKSLSLVAGAAPIPELPASPDEVLTVDVPAPEPPESNE